MCALVFLISILFVHGLELVHVEPDIQCTVIKVHQTIHIDGFKKFPLLYQTISNEPITSRLLIAGKELLDINPKTFLRTANSEVIAINTSQFSMILELFGKPISRNGVLKINGKVFAEITCH